MPDNLFIKGLILGFSIAAPVGPVGILCIQRSLNYGLGQGFVSGLGAATADALYGAVAAFSLTLITNFMVAQTQFLSLAGGLFLGYLGLKTFRQPPADYTQVPHQSGSLAGAYLSTLFLTITNPMTILFFVFIFGGLGLAEAAKSELAALLVVLGVFTGSGAWWLLLSGGTSFIRGRLEATKLRWVNKLAGVIIFGFGVFILFEKVF